MKHNTIYVSVVPRRRPGKGGRRTNAERDCLSGLSIVLAASLTWVLIALSFWVVPAFLAAMLFMFGVNTPLFSFSSAPKYLIDMWAVYAGASAFFARAVMPTGRDVWQACNPNVVSVLQGASVIAAVVVLTLAAWYGFRESMALWQWAMPWLLVWVSRRYGHVMNIQIQREPQDDDPLPNSEVRERHG